MKPPAAGHGLTKYPGDVKDLGHVARHLVEGGLTDPAALDGPRGLRLFANHGLTPENQNKVIALVRQHLTYKETQA